MISFIFKFSLSFIACFLILSFEISDKTLFSHISEITGPVGSEVQKSLKKSVDRSYKKSKQIGEEFFHNADPKYFDEINSSRSSLSAKKQKGKALEELSKEDVERLDSIIENN